MAKTDIIPVPFPLGGVDRTRPYEDQQPLTAFDAVNVRPRDAIDFRLRGGSRPGLSKALAGSVGGTPIRLLETVNTIANDNSTFWSDSFNGTALGTVWAQASWLSASPSVSHSYAISQSSTPTGVVRSDIADLVTGDYRLEMFVVPYYAQHWGSYKIFFRMNNSSPVATTDGCVAELVMNDATGAYSGSLKVYVSGVATTYAFTPGTNGEPLEGWFTVHVSGNTATCYWRGTQLVTHAVGSPAGRRFGFGTCDTVSQTGRTQIDRFRVQWTKGSQFELDRARLAISAGGNLYKESYLGQIAQVTTSLSLASDRLLQAADRGQKLFIADCGPPLASGGDGTFSGTGFGAASIPDFTALGISTSDHVLSVQALDPILGTVTATGTFAITAVLSGGLTTDVFNNLGYPVNLKWRVERGPKYYDPLYPGNVPTPAPATWATDALSLWLPSHVDANDATSQRKGTMPIGCKCVCRFRDRLVLAGSPVAPHVWYMSQQGDPFDWNMGKSPQNTGRPVSGGVAEAGQVGEPITALVPYFTDFLLFGCRNSMWILRGDPASGGKITCVSNRVGIVDKAAWCYGPAGGAIFLTRDGLYQTDPQCEGCSPLVDSRLKVPRELLDISPDLVTVQLVYDVRDRGVHIYLTPNDTTAGTVHWWFDLDTKSYWPVRLNSNHEPTAVKAYTSPDGEDSAVFLGGRDGIVRRYRNTSGTDDGTPFISYVLMGPMNLGVGDYYDGQLSELIGELSPSSGDVTWSVYTGQVAESVTTSSALKSGTWSGGRNNTERPMVRGGSWMIGLTGADHRPWALEGLLAKTKTLGMMRVTAQPNAPTLPTPPDLAGLLVEDGVYLIIE